MAMLPVLVGFYGSQVHSHIAKSIYRLHYIVSILYILMYVAFNKVTILPVASFLG